MKTILAAACIAPMTAMAGAAVANAADLPTYQPAPQPYQQQQGARDGVRIGLLSCNVGGGVGYLVGSAKHVDCTFHPAGAGGVADSYSGTIRKVGVDLGFTTRGKVVWAVFAPTAGYHTGALGGLYRGATAEATLGVGAGANLLVGGTANAIQLQPLSVSGQIGFNVAATGTSVTLHPESGRTAAAY